MTAEEIKGCTLRSIYVHNDGSGVLIELDNPRGDHGLPCRETVSLDMKSAIDIISGRRFYFNKK